MKFRAFALVIGLIFAGSSAFALSAVGLRNVLRNCLHEGVPPADRIAACDMAIHTNIFLPRDRAKLMVSRGNADLASGNLDTAFDDYNKAVGLNPEFAPGFVDLGIVLIRQGKCELAISDFNTALRLDTHLWQGLYGRSLCKAKTNDQGGAQADLAAAGAIEPKAEQQFAPVEVLPTP